MSETARVVDLQQVRRQELEEIKQRRRVRRMPERKDLGNNLVGLALSGGGLRSACFSLGLVQAFHKTGLWKFFDYLSTVSGGGYVGSYLSSKVLSDGQPFDKENFPLSPGADKKQPPEVQKFIYGGRYLLRLWHLANAYFIGLVFTNLAIFSLLVAVCALIALLWRCLDYPGFRDRLALVGLDNDLYAAMWPFIGFGSAWLIAWVVSYFRREAEAPGKIARYLLYFTGVPLIRLHKLIIGDGAPACIT
ncbi:MAG: hypothetical protein HY000_41355 [Planctomycetes bacterium]|nr:hypothetical protein [Planctomycetota bacterium]